MTLGPLFLGFMFFFDSQIALQQNGAVVSVIDVFPDFIGYLIFFYGIYKNKGTHKFLSELEKLIYAPLVISIFDFALPICFYKAVFNEDGTYVLWLSALRIVLEILEAAFTFVLFDKMEKFSEGKKETPKLSKAFMLGKIFCISGIGISFAAKIVPLFNIAMLTRILGITSNFFRVFFVWFGVIILFRAASKIGDKT